MTKTMLYKAGGPHKMHGGEFDYIITEDIDKALSDGWCLTTTEAAKPKKAPKKAVKKPAKKKAKK